jgi:hypothetical protein
MNFDEYKAELRQDIEPLLKLLKSMKSREKKATLYSFEVKPNIVEPQAKYP